MTDSEAQISDEEFQFYKNKLQTNVKDYLELDEQIIALKKAVKERTSRKKELSEKILDSMKKIDINHLNVKDGRLVYKVTNSAKGISKNTLVNGLQELFQNNDDKVSNALKTILDSRERVEKVSLHRVKLKKSLDILTD